MDALKLRMRSAHAALSSLEEALRLQEPSPLERDGAIQRFEFSFEAFWKAAQSWLREVEGVECVSPRGCLRALGSTGLVDLEETTAALAMAGDRSLTVHTYHEETAQAIFGRLPAHTALMRRALERMQQRTEA